MNSGKILVGVLAGIAVGVGMGILFAPKKGIRTRKQIVAKGENFADDLTEKFEDFVDSLNDKYQSTMQKAEGMIADSKSKHKDTKSKTASISGL